MSKIQLMIEIDEEEYRQIVDDNWFIPLFVTSIFKRGTPLPKGHGRLKDVDAFLQKVKKDREHAVYTRSWDADDVLSALDKTYAPTIIEADRSGE